MEEKYNDIKLKKYCIGQGKPSIVITAGLHGNEQTGMYTAELVWKRLQGERVKGEICIYPMCNPTAARARQRRAPEDNMDLNRTFPGKEDGSYSERLARHIWNATAGYDYLLDLHCCGLYGMTYSMHYFKKYAFASELCRAIGVKNVISSKGTRGQLYIEACEQRAQKGLLVELPGGQPGGVIDEAAALEMADNVIAYLKNIGIIEGEKREENSFALFGMRTQLKAAHDGIARPVKTAGDIVKKDDVIAYLDNEPLLAPEDGIIAGAAPIRFVFEGDDVIRFAPSVELCAVKDS